MKEVLFFCGAGLLCAVPAGGGAGAGSIIDSVIARNRSITSISCRLRHERSVSNNPPSAYQGSIDYRAPNLVLMHFLHPADEYVLVDDSMVLMYGVQNRYGMRFLKKCMKPAEKRITEQIGQVKMNMLASMRDAYDFSRDGAAEETVVFISAAPKSGWKKLSRIHIAVDTVRYTLQSISIYGRNGMLLSSTRYDDFCSVDTTDAYFPRKIEQRIMHNEFEQKDIIAFSRIRFNRVLPDALFSVPVPEDATIIDNTGACP